jgi:class 3 adenylate cyclase
MAGETCSITHALPSVTVAFCKIKTQATHSDAQEAYDDVMGSQQRVEACLAKYPLAIKIKTVGSLLIVAGPLHENATEEEHSAAARQVYDFASDIVHSAAGQVGSRGLALRAGVCTGSVMATVMGTDRIAYDIFGDTVNTASRCMSTAAEFTVQTPVICKPLYGEVVNFNASLSMSGSVKDVFMKGKGDVAVHQTSSSAFSPDTSAAFAQ